MAGIVIKRVGIVGSGIMGAGLAEVAAKAGYEVIVRSRHRATADALLGRRSTGAWPSRWTRASSTTTRARGILSRVAATDHLGDLVDCDLVIESVVEDLRRQEGALRRAGAGRAARRHLRHQHLHVARSSSWRSQTERPDRVCGLHFFNPAPLMAWSRSCARSPPSDDTIDAVHAFATELRQGAGRWWPTGPASSSTPCSSRTSTTRCGCWSSGTASMEDIDTAMKGGCNFPMGPFALLDLVGLDTSRRDPRRAVRRVPRPELRRRCRPCAAWSPPATSGGSPAAASTATADRVGRRVPTTHTEGMEIEGITAWERTAVEPPTTPWSFPDPAHRRS